MSISGGAPETARLVAELDLRNNMAAGINSALGQVGRLQTGLGRMARGTGQVASGLDRLGTRAAIAAAGGLFAVVKTAASFENAFAGIEKTVDATAPQFAKLNEQFREMARTVPVSFEELAGIGAAGGALGIARQDLLDFTDVVARLAVSTNLSSDQAATALGQLGNVLHLSGGEFREFADSLVNLGNKGASTESQIVDIAARFGAAGNAAGLSKEEILALSSAVASMGIQTEAAGSSLSRLFNNVATNIGTSNSKAQAFAKALGLSAREFRDAWQKDALGTFQDFLRQLNKLDQFQAASLLKKVGITNTRDIAAMRLMGQNVGFVAEQLEVAKTGQGALNKESQKFFDTATGQWKTLVNIIRDSATTIGNEVLPITKDLIKQLGTFLNDPKTRAGLKSFGQDLARGIKDVVTTLRTTDFSGLIDGMKTAGAVAKEAFGLFRSLPPEVQALAISAIALNKVSGGAVGSIAKGLGNIFAGALQQVLPKALGSQVGGFLGGRGSSPANPLFVAMVAGGPGAGIPGVGGGGSGFWGGVGKLLGVGFVAVAGLELGNAIGDALGLRKGVTAATSFEQGQFNDVLTRTAGDPQRIQAGIDAIDQGITDLVNQTGPFLFLFGDQADALKAQREALLESLEAAKKQQAASFENNRQNESLINEAKAGRLATAHAGEVTAAAFKTLESRLIGDRGFKTHLDADAFIKVLRRTSEFGAKGTGTTIEQGPRTGRDPTGQAFVALVKRLEPAALHNPVVLGEIRRHIIAAEEIQRTALREGDRKAARKLQTTIDTLHQILGTEDKNNALHRQALTKQEATKRSVDRMQERTVAHMQSILNSENRTAANTGIISRKDFSPNINIEVPLTAILSVNDVIRQIVHTRTAIGTGPGGPAPLIGPGS